VRFHLVANGPTPTNTGLVRGLREIGVEACVTAPADLRSVQPGDTALGRIDVLTTLDGVEPGLWAFRRLRHPDIRVLNSASSLMLAHDKLATALRLARLGIPHPRTAYIDGAVQAPSVELPVVVKPRFGSWGRDVFICRDEDELSRCLEEVRTRTWFRRQGVLVQALVPPVGFDLRVLVAGGEVAGAIQRIAAPGEWRTNVALGARRLPVTPPPAACAVALTAAAAVGAHLVGVDLLPDGEGGWVVLELNGAVDFTPAYSLDGVDVFARVARSLVVEDATAIAAALA
jgi:RimK family alpha-L-glutamate ligase